MLETNETDIQQGGSTNAIQPPGTTPATTAGLRIPEGIELDEEVLGQQGLCFPCNLPAPQRVLRVPETSRPSHAHDAREWRCAR